MGAEENGRWQVFEGGVESISPVIDIMYFGHLRKR